MPERDNNLPPLGKLAMERFGGRTYAIENVYSVGTTRIDLIRNDPNRIMLRLINEGVFDIRVSTSPNISPISGWLVVNGGGMLELFWEEDGETVGYTLYAIANGGITNVRVMEVRIS